MADETLVSRVGRAIREARDADTAVREAVRIIHESSERYDWTGVYLLSGERGLILSHFVGDPSPHTRIDIGSGICGAAAREKATIIVGDVNADPRYLACSIRTRSEIVVPIMAGGVVYGEIDIDSHQADAFGEEDRRELERIAALLAGRLSDVKGAR